MPIAPAQPQAGPMKQPDHTPSSSRFGSAASLVPLSPTAAAAPLSNGETPEPTPCERGSSVSGATNFGKPPPTASVRTSQGTTSPNPSNQAPVPYPRPAYPSVTNSTGSFSLPNIGRGENREPSVTSLLMTARDAPAEIITGIRYRYMPAISKWNQEEIVLRVLHPNRGVSQDPLHAIFAVQLLPERDPGRSLNTTGEYSSATRGGHVDPNAPSDPMVDDFDEETERFMPALARMFRHTISNVAEEDYFGEAQCQAMAEEFAHIYHRMKLPDAGPGQRRPPFPLLTNRFLVRVPKINIPDTYLEATKGFFSYRTHDTHEVMFLIEPDVSTCDALDIRFPPINTADARVADLGDEDGTGEEPYYPRGDPSWDKARFVEVAEAFSHMTYHLSGRALLVEGMQRTCGYLVDPIVYSKDRKQFGMCNNGLRGLSKWVARHHCNDVCALMQLPPVKRSTDEPSTATDTDNDAQRSTISPLDTYGSYLTDFAQCLCSMVVLPMHRGQQARSRSPMAASPLPQFSPRRGARLTGPASPITTATTSAPALTSQPAPMPQVPVVVNVSSPLSLRRVTPQRQIPPSPPEAHGTRPSTPTPAGGGSSSGSGGQSPSPKKTGAPGPHPSRLPARPTVPGSPTGTAPLPRPIAASGRTATTIRVASPRVTRKGPPPNVAASARRGSNGTATGASASPTAAPSGSSAASRAPAKSTVTLATALPYSAPAPQIAEPVKTSTPPSSATRGGKPRRSDATSTEGTPARLATVLETPDRQDGAPRSTGMHSPLRPPNAVLRSNESPTFSRTSPRTGARRRASSANLSPVSVGGQSPNAKSRFPLGTTRPTAAGSPPPRPIRNTRKSSSTPDPALQPLPAPAPPAKLPASARGITKNVAFVRTPTTRALPFERQPSGPPLVKQRPLSRQATTGSLPSMTESGTSLTTPASTLSPRGPPRPDAVPAMQRPPVPPSGLPLAAKPTNATVASPLKRTPARNALPASGRTPPPQAPLTKAPEAFKRSATDVPIRSYGVGSPLLLRTNHAPPAPPPRAPLTRPPAPAAGLSSATPVTTTTVTTAPPLVPASPARERPPSSLSAPPPPPQEPSKPSRSPEIDALAQTTGGLDIQRQFIFPATKYVYNVQKLEWRRHRTLIRICNPETGVAQGAMRVCFEVNELSLRGNGSEVSHVAKMFRRTVSNVVEQDYFTEVEMQCLCGEFARNYNMEPIVEANTAANPRVVMDYVTAVVISFDQKDIPEDLWAQRKGFFSYHTSDTDRCMFSMEPMLVGHFTKYNSNFGEAYRSNEKPLGEAAAAARFRVFEAAEALSHYSLVKSGGGLLLCDVQGVGSALTDPEMHTYDGEGLSIGNMGKRGIDRFAQRHRCNDACRAIGLKSLCLKAPKVTPEVMETNEYLKIMHKMRSTFTKCA